MMCARCVHEDTKEVNKIHTYQLPKMSIYRFMYSSTQNQLTPFRLGLWYISKSVTLESQDQDTRNTCCYT